MAWRENRDISGVLALFGLTLLGWYALHINHAEYWDIYDSYKDTGKVMVFTAIIIFVVSNIRFTFSAMTYSVLLIVAVLITNFYAIYQGVMLNAFRLQIDFARATVIAYIFTMMNIVMLGAILELKSQYRYLIFLFAALSGLAAITWTETRAALLTCPVLILLLLFVHPRVQKAQRIKLCAAFIVILVLLGVTFQQKLTDRYHELRNDITLYQGHNSVSSIGARLVMFQTGLRAALDAPFGESAEQRADNIKQQVKVNPALAGALNYIDVHMHNEFIENFSLRGIFGVITLLVLYVVLLLNAWRKRNAIQGILLVTVIIYGFSDVIFFGKESTIVFSMALILSVLHQKIVTGRAKCHE